MAAVAQRVDVDDEGGLTFIVMQCICCDGCCYNAELSRLSRLGGSILPPQNKITIALYF